jgi:LCP family protein required for cell wall assembly
LTEVTVTADDPWGERKRVNVLLLGGDGAVHRPGVRTDSVILASIEAVTGDTVLFSLPRNLRNVPFRAGSKLAEVYPDGFTGSSGEAEYFLNAIYRNIPALHPGILGRSDNEGADAVKLAVAGALGIRVDYYVLVNLAGFQQLVDAMGGITVNINDPVPIGGNSDAGIPPEDYLQPGPDQRLNGFQALWFTRGRYGSSDYQRMERQRCAINAIAAEASPLKLLRRYTKLASASKDIVRTDIPSNVLPAFVDLAGKVKGRPLKSVSFELSNEFNPNDPDFDYVRSAVQAALNPPPKPKPQVPGGSTASPAAPSTTAGGAATETEAAPSELSDATEDCAYRPPSAEDR